MVVDFVGRAAGAAPDVIRGRMLQRLPGTWARNANQIALQLDNAGLRALAEQARALAPHVAAAQAIPEAAAMLAPALMTALALRQLHADAAALW